MNYMGMLEGLKNLVGVETDEENEIPEQESSPRRRNLRIVRDEAKVLICKVVMFEDVNVIAENFLDGSSIILNLETTEKELKKRVLDFLSGVAFAVGGSVNQVSQGTFMLTNANVSVCKEGLYDYDDYSTI